jgi:hypothetical protein
VTIHKTRLCTDVSMLQGPVPPLLNNINKGKGRSIDPVMDEGPQPGLSRLGKQARSTESGEGECSTRPAKRRRCDQASSLRKDKKKVVIRRDDSGNDSITMVGRLPVLESSFLQHDGDSRMLNLRMAVMTRSCRVYLHIVRKRGALI